ncbi:threonine-phosphate decarboxylase [Haloglomus irregulare]|uniref:Aminotransferase n=1 Tax=Haloglomus irregulare TaxID=2234134 RepID=A0A554MWA9_9EURY|nr:aminotransferase class I/II-fold pyridoxal phosphate-dependent enzyme [Haloglomus irregulare]TSD09412.1 threonine-phosphate decarboxylase [Haloglomus irregulare]
MNPDGVDRTDRVPHGSSDDPDVLDFSANINPRTPPGTRAVYEGALDAARSYPPRGYPEFRAAAADYADCDPERVVPTGGGLQAIRLTIATHVEPGDSVLVPAPSFGEYAREVRLQGGDPVLVAPEELVDADPTGHTLAVACVPNNPTGYAPDPAALRAFARRCRDADTLLLADEAFLGFTDRESLAGRAGVVAARSLTKLFGLPGLRAGFAVATGRALDRLRTAVPAWAIGTPAAAVGAHAMRDDGFVRETRDRVTAERDRMHERLTTRFDVRESAAPFLCCRLRDDDPDGSVDALVARLAAADIAVRDATTFRGLDRHVRVAVRLPAANDRLLEALDV